MEKLNYVYIFDAPFNNQYIGVTSDLEQRVRAGARSRKLVWYEPYPDLSTAIEREKQLKRYRQVWKRNLIERENPAWNDLAEAFGLEPLDPPIDSTVDPGTSPG